jgi:hypothetical protein
VSGADVVCAVLLALPFVYAAFIEYLQRNPGLQAGELLQLDAKR